jgi:hypothetical protein
MKKLYLFIGLLVWAKLSFSSGLPPEHEMARLLIALEESVSKNSWALAADQLKQMRDLELRQPPESLFYEGMIKIHLEEFNGARLVLEKYVISEGSKGKYYEDALRLITKAEYSEIEHQKAQQELGFRQDSTVELIDSSQRDGYIKSLQALYLTKDPIEALKLQVNSLLSAHPYTGSRIKKSGVKEGVIYQIDVAKGVLTLQEKNYQNGTPVLSIHSLDVPGLDPFIGVACSSREYMCWLQHPTDKYSAWIKIDYDELVVEELRDAMTKLLQAIQKDM